MDTGRPTAWSYCTAFADRVLAHARGDPALRLRLRDSYRTWGVDASGTEAKACALIALALHSCALDLVAGGAPTAAIAGRVRLCTLEQALFDRPAHELFAALPAPAAEDGHILALKLLLHSHGRRWSGPATTTIYWVRVATTAATLLAAAAPDPRLPCSAVLP